MTQAVGASADEEVGLASEDGVCDRDGSGPDELCILPRWLTIGLYMMTEAAIICTDISRV